MASIINLFELLSKADVRPATPNAPIPPVAHLMLRTMTPELLDGLASPVRRCAGAGKGGNTNHSERFIMRAFRRLGEPDLVFQPNGTQKFPDMRIGNETIEWKSVAAGNHFGFNDSLPRGWAHYYFVSRKKRRILVMRGDVVLLACDREIIEDVRQSIERARAYGRTTKKSGCLCYFYPRPNLYIRNFLTVAPANGWYDFDRNTIWTPAEG